MQPLKTEKAVHEPPVSKCFRLLVQFLDNLFLQLTIFVSKKSFLAYSCSEATGRIFVAEVNFLHNFTF